MTGGQCGIPSSGQIVNGNGPLPLPGIPAEQAPTGPGSPGLSLAGTLSAM